MSCLRLGLTLNDFRRLKVGTILDLIKENLNQYADMDEKKPKKEEIRKATQADIDAIFHRV